MVVILACSLAACEGVSPSPDNRPKPKPSDPGTVSGKPSQIHDYNIFLGNTHSHCNYSGDVKLTAENTPDKHFKTAKDNGYDFYFITDHSQYEDRYTQEAWTDLAQAAKRATTSSFVAMRGFEHSENNGPGAKGHLNVFNSATFLNALAEGMDIPFFQKWVSSSENGGVVVSMNHPGPAQYSDFACYDEASRKNVALLEVINGKNLHHEAFIKALSKGWKVSPVAGCDNHSWEGIPKWEARTGIAADALTPEDVLDALRSRRTYATFDKNLKAVYYADNHPMGSEFRPGAPTLHVHVLLEDPDTSDPKSAIARVEIVGEGEKVLARKDFSSHKVVWETDVERGKNEYAYLKVYNGSAATPIAYLAPVWLR